MKIKKHIFKCRKCGDKNKKRLLKVCLSSKGIQYYMCRLCNTEKMRKYMEDPENRKRVYAAVYRSIKKYPEKQSARIKVWRAIKLGKLKKPKKCSSCNIKGKVFAHHEDYTKPLEVSWYCRSCHCRRDKKKNGKM